MYDFKYIENNKEFDEYMYLQIDDKPETYHARSVDEVKSLGSLLSNTPNGKILDLGCGLGRSSIFIKNTLKLDNTHFYLCDFNNKEFNKSEPCGEHLDSVIPYNNLNLTNEFTTLNGITNKDILNLNDPLNLNNIDIIYSFHCVGYHWDIETSFIKHNLESITSDNAIMIFGVRKKKSKLKFPTKVGSFHLVDVIKGSLVQDFVVYKKINKMKIIVTTTI
jgi:SAM-dependent methyltransferase